MKNQALFSSKDKSKKLKCHLLQFLFGALRVKINKSASTCAFSLHFLRNIFEQALKSPRNFLNTLSTRNEN